MFLFGSSLIVRLFPRRFFHGPTVVNGMARFLGGSFLGPPVIVRLFPRRFFHGPMLVNGMRVPLDMTNSKRKKIILKRYVYTTVLHIVLIYMEKKEKQMFMEMICLYNCFTNCI